jgi:hypothetical protein
LDFNSEVHRVDDTPELDNCAIAGTLDDAAVMDGDRGVDQIAAKRSEPRQNPILVGKASGGRLKDTRGMSIIGLSMAALPCRA